MKFLNFKKSFILLLIQLFLFLPFESQNIEDNNLLKIFLKDIKKESKRDSIFIGSNNNNAYIIQNFDEYLELKRDSFIKMPNQISQKVNGEYKFVNIKKGDSNYKQLLKKPWVSIKPDGLLHRVYRENEYEHFKTQLVDGEWQIDFNKFDGIYQSKKTQPENMVFYISKPIYTIDGNFALMHIYSKNVRICIYIYRKEKINSWNRVYTIPHHFIDY